VNSLHGVGLDHAHVDALLEPSVHSDRVDLLCDKVSNDISDLHAEDQAIWEFLLELEHETAIATADVHNSWDQVPSLRLLCASRSDLFEGQIGYRVLVCVDIELILVIVLDSIEGRVVERPVDAAGIHRAI
jgi:hypothetical protein